MARSYYDFACNGVVYLRTCKQGKMPFIALCKCSSSVLQMFRQNVRESAPEEGEDEMAGGDGEKKPRMPHMFCKTLTASDTSTHGGFSVPRRAAEDCFAPLVRRL